MLQQNRFSWEENLPELVECINFAAIKHKNQRRLDKEQTPYINHPIGKKSLEIILFMNFNFHSAIYL